MRHETRDMRRETRDERGVSRERSNRSESHVSNLTSDVSFHMSPDDFRRYRDTAMRADPGYRDADRAAVEIDHRTAAFVEPQCDAALVASTWV